jgi:hypothetical protein
MTQSGHPKHAAPLGAQQCRIHSHSVDPAGRSDQLWRVDLLEEPIGPLGCLATVIVDYLCRQRSA